MYSDKAFTILNSSINSAVFIDEKAKDFYSGTPINTDVVEEKLSGDLFKTFKENGKSLIVHKFKKEHITDNSLVNYLFTGKDLILLDWELDDNDGQQYSLELLSKAIETPYINFCCIYSRSANFDNIPLYLTAYFSGLQEGEFENIKNNYAHLTIEEIANFRKNPNNDIDSFFNENQIIVNEFPVENFRDKPKEIILDLINIALDVNKYFFSKEAKINHEVIYSGEDSFIINNTFVLAIKKEQGDSDYKHLIKRISGEIVKNKSSFFQLLGLEMQSVFNSNERFIDETILKSSTEALFQFRNHINDDKTFGIIIKKLLLEQATLKLRTAKLELLKTDFLDFKSKELDNKEPSNEDLFQLNVFHNSVSVKSLNPDDIPNLNFGDVFKGSGDDYYLCITALCDCYEPKKIDYNFYFVKGAEFEDIELALMLGDTAFISFLPNGKAVYWGNLDDPKIKKIKKPSLSNSDDAQKLKNDIETLNQIISNLSSNQNKLNNFLYKPFYIKPKIYNVTNNKLVDNKIEIWDITNKPQKDTLDQNLNYYEVEYITTLRNDYAQRIANHAFGHPARVGVDFVKKK
ncbi:response regulator receiver domain [Chryseobacterium taklimakanense]|uniref:response regulator receiver domain n=1 Tax=Chryseobacterium taklimakanense TaxID=536441 RepID=UPI001EF72835|nr:response regulator receiver domain [Chryseobacterium taklimakanense]MCG7281502.1 response regulator receiver domain [Chryseobacterium taklimakanense]